MLTDTLDMLLLFLHDFSTMRKGMEKKGHNSCTSSPKALPPESMSPTMYAPSYAYDKQSHYHANHSYANMRDRQKVNHEVKTSE